jgi:hypothetical protein
MFFVCHVLIPDISSPVQGGEEGVWSIQALDLDAEALAVVIVTLEEAADLCEEAIAVWVPLGGSAEELDGFTQAGEVDLFGSSFAKMGDLVTQVGEEGELEAVAGLAGGFFQRDGHRRREGLERAFGLEVFFHAAADLIEEGKVLPLCGMGGAQEGISEPAGIVVVDLVAADLEDGAIADERDHGFI